MFKEYRHFDEKKPKRKIFSPYFFVITIIISVVFFLLLLDSSKKYQSEISIIVIPKSEKAAADSEHIVENLKIFPTKLSFYEKLIRDNDNLRDNLLNFSDGQKRNIWNKDLEVRREEGSSIITIAIVKDDSEEARLISKAVTSNLLNIAGFYYDIKRDIDIRIVEGPIIRSFFSNWILIIISSIAIGIIISFLINFIFHLSFDYLEKKRRETGIRLRDTINEKKSKIKREETRKPSEEKAVVYKKIEEKKDIQYPISQTLSKKASAPENLPFIDEEYFRSNIIKTSESTAPKTTTEKSLSEDTSKNKEKEEAELHREPTQEEFKKRLNQLLRGDL